MTTPDPGNQSLDELFGRVTGDLSTLMREEMQLAKGEIKQEVRTASKAGGLLGGGALCGYLALLFFSLAVAIGLAEFVWDWLAFLIVAAAYGIVAAVLISKGRNKAKEIDPVPQQTVQTLKEDVQWAKTRTK